MRAAQHQVKHRYRRHWTYGYDDLNDENAYDPEGAKQVLEDAGYKDVDGDGYVEDPDGNPVELDFRIL